MDLIQVVDTMSEEMYLRLKSAAETGKWPEGTVVDKAQQESALQLIMAYQSRHLNADEMMTVGSDGHLVNKTKRQLKADFPSAKAAAAEKSVNDIARFTQL